MGPQATGKKGPLLILFVLILLCYLPLRAYAAVTYVGNKNTMVYHYSWCSSVKQMKPEHMVNFTAPQDAVAAGYRPCQNCNPPVPEFSSVASMLLALGGITVPLVMRKRRLKVPPT